MNKQRGFTLIEIMVVVVILGILAAIVVPKIMSRPDEARIVKARQDIMAIQSALDLYRLDNGRYPTTDQGLAALVELPNSEPIPTNWKSYLKSIPIDPWNRPYQYLNPGEHGEIDIFTYGPDGNSGNRYNATSGTIIGNWNADRAK
jgi:general secretion pathway protein G